MKKFIISFIFLIAVGLGMWFWRQNILDASKQIAENLPQIQKLASDIVTKTAEEISLPPPLRSDESATAGQLTAMGVIQWTNNQRRHNNSALLTENAKLNAAAAAKVKDMFDQQYFEHKSPDGRQAADLAHDQNYAFIAIGENLALGNFADDQTLVEAWMNSPGHRENILSHKFTEIGVAVGEGMYEGKKTWLAVQEFGRPASDCTVPSEDTKKEIDTKKTQLDGQEKIIRIKRQEIENTSKEDTDTYNARVREFNTLVNQFNELLEQTKQLISNYNTAVNSYNDCVQGL